ncbi:cobaltochelatase subunit CobN [Synechococcus elongatus IITB4]|uniref:cobaltochelatase subunit CobN n=1 Tax=Synechococcus elongatus TaxID=32046 RepID=UPI0030D21F83
MHRLAAIPGGWTPATEGVIFVEQSPAPIVFLTAADTDISAIAQARAFLPADFPAVRVVNLLQLQQQLSIDTYAESVLAQAQVILLRLLGGRSYWSYGLEVVRETVQRSGATLIVLPGDNQPDLDLMSQSTLPLAEVQQGWQYFLEGGVANLANALRWAAHQGLSPRFSYELPQRIPAVGRYPFLTSLDYATAPQVGILFYRAHYLAGNLAAIDALCQALCDRGLYPVPLFVTSLRDADIQAEIVDYFKHQPESAIQVLINTTSFSVLQPLALQREAIAEAEPSQLWQLLDVPVLQVILSGGSLEGWQQDWRGLSPRDVAMNVALPEVDGRIITRAISFKATQGWNLDLETDVLGYQPLPDRIQFVADLAANWVKLRLKPTCDRKVALILANYPTRNGRIANGVGLDTPASCLEILQALQQEGYSLSNLPENVDQLIQQLTAGITNDPETQELNPVYQRLSHGHYCAWFQTLPTTVQSAIQARWGSPKEDLAIAGIQLGNVFIGIQPARGYDADPALNYHAPDLEPTHDYLAFYEWLRSDFGADAIVHVGKHGNLEWLPGKSLALSEQCYPEVALGPLPHFYPFIVNDPGEGSQAKRRSQAVILDHLTPPMTRAELYGGLQKLESLIDEYYDAQTLDPTRLPAIRDRISQLIQQDHLSAEIQGLTPGHDPQQLDPDQLAALITNADRYLCELKESQIRDGLHIFGSCPQGRQLRDLIISIARHPTAGRQGLTRAIAQAYGLEFDPLTADLASLLTPSLELQSSRCRTVGEAVEQLEAIAADAIDQLLQGQAIATITDSAELQSELTWINQTLLPNLRQTDQEMTALLCGLAGHYIPAGPSGAPTRGRPEVLPTGRNFYAVDIRSLPTESAWDVGRKAADRLIEAYTQEQGEYPQTLALSLWGTATMRTGGDDLAEAMALIGVQPVWEGSSRRVIDFEILPLSLLQRPRVDVTLRISGFFRDAFPNLIDLFDQAIAAVADLEEPEDWNPIAAKVRQETAIWQQQGLPFEQAQRRSRYRIFGSKPGAYGAGLQGLIESQNWDSADDLGRAYLNWSSYAYSGQGIGQPEPEAFTQRLQQLQIVLQNQDNREHDILDSDDYYQFQGGLAAATALIQGQQPQLYFGDHSCVDHPKVRSLQQEIARVYRSRVINPKWIDGAMRHGYKGAFEMAATLDFLFAYDATTALVPDYMYQGVAEAYLIDSKVQHFIQTHNPWALRDMAERLLEAEQRGLWQHADARLIAQLRSLSLEVEADIEGRLGSIPDNNSR